jgi:hypothetical protein
MARTIDSAKRVLSGTFGEVWVDGEKIAGVAPPYRSLSSGAFQFGSAQPASRICTLRSSALDSRSDCTLP